LGTQKESDVPEHEPLRRLIVRLQSSAGWSWL
jgi:hypothetical protein